MFHTFFMYLFTIIFRYTETIKPKHVLKKELEDLWNHLEALKSPVVFCHNDLLLKNIIYSEEKGKVWSKVFA